MTLAELAWEQRWSVATALVVLYFGRIALAYYRLRQFKGPFLASISDLPCRLRMLGPDSHKWYREVSEKYGKIARIAPNLLMTSSPEVWTQVNLKPAFKRSAWFYNAVRIEHRRDNVFSQTDNEKHHQRRKQMAPGYSGRENLDLEPAVDAQVEKFVALIRQKYLSTEDHIQPMDLAKKMQFFTLDVISAVGLGKTFGMLSADRDIDSYIESSEAGLRAGAIALACGFAWIVQLPWIGAFIAPSPTKTDGFGKMMAACFKAVDERTANPTDTRSDMLASFIRHGLQEDELRTEALEQIIAGSETVASGLRGTMLYLISHQRAYRKLQREIDAVVSEGQVAGVVSLARARQMPYLQAAIREGLRLWPPAVNIFPRDVPAGGDTVLLDGKEVYLPPGCCIGYSAWAMHRSTEIYGDDADAFRPERWFEKDEARLARMTRTNDLVFGYGNFHCLGKPIAQLELSKGIFALLQNFDWALRDPTRPWKTTNLMGLFAIEGMWVQVSERITE